MTSPVGFWTAVLKLQVCTPSVSNFSGTKCRDASLCKMISTLIRVSLCLFTSLSSPQKSREVNRDLQIQLDQLLQQAQDPSSRGNSLFAEVKSKLSYSSVSAEGQN